MGVAKPLDAFGANFDPGFAKKPIGEQAPAHAYLATDAPNRQFDALCIERLLPCKNMLIDAINERAVEIKQEGRFRYACYLSRSDTLGRSAPCWLSIPDFLQTAPAKDRIIETRTLDVP